MAQPKLNKKYTFQEFCQMFPGKIENLVLEKLREIQYLPRHLNSEDAFLKECMENVEYLRMVMGFDSPVIKDYIEGLSYEKDYISIVSSFMKNPNKSLQNSKNALTHHPLTDLFTLSNFKDAVFHKRSSDWNVNILLRNWGEKIIIHNEQELIAQVSNINKIFKEELSNPRENSNSEHLGSFKGICDLKMVCNDSVIFKNVPLLFDYDTSSLRRQRIWLEFFQLKQEVKINLGHDGSKREYANLIFNPYIKTQLVEYLLK